MATVRGIDAAEREGVRRLSCNREPRGPMSAGEPLAEPVDGIPLRRYWKRGVAGVALAVIAGVLVLHFTTDDTGWDRLREFPRGLIPVILAMIGVAWVCNGLRTWLLARALGHRLSLHRAVGITLSTEFAIAATPGGVGGMATRIGLQRQAGIPVPHTMTMMAGDASADILYFLLLAPFALRQTLQHVPVDALWPGFDWIGAAPWVVGGAVGLGLALWLLKRCGIGRIVRVLPESWRRKGRLDARWRGIRKTGRQQLREVGAAARYLARERRSYYAAAFVLASIQWTCRYGVLPVILWGLGAWVDPLALVFVQGTLFIVGLLVVAPGGGGALEILTTLILRPLVGGGTAALAVVLWRLFTYYLYLAGGACAFGIMVWRGSTRSSRHQSGGPMVGPTDADSATASRANPTSDAPEPAQKTSENSLR